VTGRHWGPKQKLLAGYSTPSGNPRFKCHHLYFCLLDIHKLYNASDKFSSSSAVSRTFSYIPGIIHTQ